MMLVLDNYDSFTYNLVHLLYGLEQQVLVRRNREINADELLEMRPEALIVTSGPGLPQQAGNLLALLEAAKGVLPVLGVGLGHLAIGHAFGAEIVPARQIMHGKISVIQNDGQGLFQGLRDQFKAVRYHSLALREASLPPELEVTARSEDGEVMGVRHRNYLIEAVQYHPEAVMSANGKAQLANFIRMVDEQKRNEVMAC